MGLTWQLATVESEHMVQAEHAPVDHAHLVPQALPDPSHQSWHSPDLVHEKVASLATSEVNDFLAGRPAARVARASVDRLSTRRPTCQTKKPYSRQPVARQRVMRIFRNVLFYPSLRPFPKCRLTCPLFMNGPVCEQFTSGLFTARRGPARPRLRLSLGFTTDCTALGFENKFF